MSHKLSVSGDRQQLDGLQAASAQASPEILVILDSKVDDYACLAAGLAAGTAVAVLDESRDGVKQITSLLGQYNAHNQLSQVHVISHGAPGCLYLGNTELSLDTLERYAAQVSGWFASSEAAVPSLLLYGCNLAAGDAGAEFLEKLHGLTGAAIAASTTRTGSADQGGDWNLEVTLGNPVVDVAIAPATQATYAGVLAPMNAEDYAAIKALYDNTGGASWIFGTGETPWALSGNTVPDVSVASTWTGLTFNGNGRVSGITLVSKNLIGVLPSALNGLSEITTLNLGGNGLSGSIPSSLADLEGLQTLDLSGNILSGAIPDTFSGGNLPNLTVLLLFGNRRLEGQGSVGSTGLTGPIPTGLGTITTLTELDLSNNGLTGSIPASLGTLTSLNNLKLSDNGLSGDVPAPVLALPTAPTTTVLLLDNPISAGGPLADQQVAPNTPAFVFFTVSDIDAAGNSPAANIQILELASDNPALVTVTDTSTAGGGARRLTLTPAAGQTGVATITFKLSDGEGGDFDSIQTFQVVVGDVPSTKPVVQTNQLSIAEGGAVVLTEANLNTVDANDGPNELTYTVSNIIGGRFEVVGLAGNAVTSFTQQQVNASQIRFVHDGGEVAPSYTVVVKDNEQTPNTSTPSVVSIGTFTKVNDAPTGVTLTPLTTAPLPENASANAAVRVANIAVVDPDAATSNNTLSLTGANAALFEVADGSTPGSKVLQLKRGAAIADGSTYTVDVNVDDPTIGTAGSTEATQRFSLTAGRAVLVSNDANGDLTTDLVFRNTATGQSSLSLSGATTPTATSFGPAIRDAKWKIQAVGNFNKDGISDFVWRNIATGQNVIWLGGGVEGSNALVNSAVAIDPVTDRKWEIAGAGDFNNDTISDLLWYNQTDNQLSVWYTNATNPATTASRAAIATGQDAQGLTLEATGDFDGNGKWDLLWSNQAGALSIWFMDGVQRVGLATPVLGVNGQSIAKPTDFYIAGTGNFDTGATSDIALISNNGASTQTWLMNSAQLSEAPLSGSTPATLAGTSVYAVI